VFGVVQGGLGAGESTHAYKYGICVRCANDDDEVLAAGRPRRYHRTSGCWSKV